ncbi:MAG: TerC/Alx family metal homeostasis membrane protein [Bowdeniella nasicola]|nr:TerC/Alx family metal homeostasis membrane protein [Bowdeniella nasicola]
MIVMILVIVFDLLWVVRRPHIPTMRECSIWVGIYVTAALLFGGILALVANGQLATEFYAGWITEYSLSVDNLFIFVIILSRFHVPLNRQQEVLMIGIIIALVLRGIMILIGAAVIARFSWVFFIFGVFLLWTAISLIRSHGEDEYRENQLIKQLRKVLPLQDEYEGMKLRVKVDGKTVWTPLLIVILALGSTDLLFALDSIPAIFGLTKDPFVVFSTNLFALMGLRQLYFLLGGLLDRVVYLPYGLAVILGFIGVKLIFEALHTNSLSFINNGQPFEHIPHISIVMSLGVIIGVLIITIGASLIKSRGPRKKPSLAE